MNKIEIFMFGFLKPNRVLAEMLVDLALELQREIVCKLFGLLCLVLFSGSCSYTLCTGGHFESIPSFTKRSTTVLLDS